MIGRWLLIFWLLPISFVSAQTYSKTFTGIVQSEDAQIYNNSGAGGWRNAYKNYGGAASASISHDADEDYRFLTRFFGIDDSLGVGARIVAETLFIKTGSEQQHAGDIKAFRLSRDWTEGTMVGTEVHSYMAPGVSWIYSSHPPYPDTVTTANLPAYFSWDDSNCVTTAKNQGTSGTCFDFGSVSVFESAYKIQQLLHQGVDIDDNSGDGLHVDRSGVVLGDTVPGQPIDTFRVTQTGWKWITLCPGWLANEWWSGTGAENGIFLMQQDGQSSNVFASEEDATNPIIVHITYKRKVGGLYEDRDKRVTGTTSILSSYINSGAATTNYGSADSLSVSGTTKSWVRLVDIFTLAADYDTGSDSTYGILNVKCSVYVETNVTDGLVGVYRAFKQPIESEITYNQWKSGFEWGLTGANKVDELDIAEQQALNCADGQSVVGGLIDSTLLFWQFSTRTGGSDSAYVEADMPYTGSIGACPDTNSYTYYTAVGSIFTTPVNSNNELKKAVLIAPVVLNMTIYTSTAPTFASYTSGCYDHDASGSTSGHAVTLYGWDDSFCSGTGAWLIKNSWGWAWGERGNIRVKYGTCNIPPSSITDEAFFVSTTTPTYRWNTAGAGGSSDYVSNPLATDFASLTGDEWLAFPIDPTTAQVIHFGNDYGFILRPSDTTQIVIYTSEATGTANDPYLRVWYNYPTTSLGNMNIGNNVRIGN